MSQYVSDRKVDEVFLKSDSQDGKRCAADLIMLRAAVRRVLGDSVVIRDDRSIDTIAVQMPRGAWTSLRAEMAGIDGNGNGGAS